MRVTAPSRDATDEVTRRFSRGLQASLVLEGALVGAAGGAVVTLYRAALAAAEGALRAATGAAAGHPALMVLWGLALLVMLLAVCRLVIWEPATSGSGIPQTDAEVAGRMDAPWARVIPAKFAEGTLLALSGLSLGREGPSVQLGGMSGKAVSRALRRGRGEERLLVTCGAAAGMSAAFHAPLTGVLFALEEIHREFTAPLIISVMCSAVVSDLIASQALGLSPVLALAFQQALPHASYLLVALLGVACGLLGAAHNRGMFLCKDAFGRMGSRLPYARLAVPFALAWLVAFLWPDLMCGGDAIVEAILAPEGLATTSLLALLAGKYVFTAVCFGSGAPGGTLFPLVVMGALVGGAFSRIVCEPLGLGAAYFPNFVALGIAGLFSGVVRAPVTAVVLVFELTGSFDALLSAVLVSIAAYVTSSLTGTDAFYEHLLAGLLGGPAGVAGNVVTRPAGTCSARPAGEGGAKTLRTVRVGTGSRIEGMLVRDVPWPDGVRVVTVERAGTEILPTGDTRILALDELLVIADATTADDAILKLGVMCAQRVRGGD